MAQRFRIFISSPSDVFAERERVERVITRLNGEFGGDVLEAVRWERSYYTAAKTFQDQIPLPSETDLVVCILWKRLGFELPPDYRRADGTTPTGTEYEFEDAMTAARAKGTPDVLVYRKSATVMLNAEQVEMERAQFDALNRFWAHWFRSETGQFTAAYQSFETTDQLEAKLEDHIRQWLARHKVASAGVTWPIETRGSPFRGLQPFDADHAEVFFGRRRAIERARERLADAAQRGTPFLLILGTSGTGKSSLARAGLVPRLAQPGAVAGVDVWRRCVMRPSEGDTPLHALARALYRPDAVPELGGGDTPTPPDLAALLASAPDAAARALRLALVRGTAAIAAREGFDRPVEARLLLVVDQFEEALADPVARDAFAGALAALAASGVVWIVATLRSDLYAPFQASATLMALRDGGVLLDLVPPAAAEIAEIIAQPAAAAGLRYDPGGDTPLDEALGQAADQRGALPLLQLTLDALFEARDPASNLLTWAAYRGLGGLSGVVERRAEATLATLDPNDAGALPVVLRALVDVTEDGVVTSRAAPLPQAASNPAARRLVDGFVAARLLVADSRGDATTIRVAHDALLSGWPRAAALIEADREGLRTRFRVEAATRRWLQEGRDADFLLPPGRPLAEASELAVERPESLDPDSAAFITASNEADAARRAAADAASQRALRLEAEAQQARADAATRVVRRTRAAAAVVSVLLVAAAGAAFFANAERQEAQRQTEAAQRNFRAALEGGASLVSAVTDHLRDGGMTRDVARGLLGTAGDTLGGLVDHAPGTILPGPLQETQSRMQASLSTVQLAVCDSAGARSRALAGLDLAEAVAAHAPSPARQLAVVQRLDTLGLAAVGDGDKPAAEAAYARAERIVADAGAPPHGPLDAALQAVRRDAATLKLIEEDPDAALALFRSDLAWQQAEPPGGQEAAALQALDLRRIGAILLNKKALPGAREALDAEAAILRTLGDQQPNNLEWQRDLSINIRQQSTLAQAGGQSEPALVLARQAAEMAAAVAARDPGNAEWRTDLMIADVHLGSLLMRTDPAAVKRELSPALASIKGLSKSEVSSLECRVNAALLHRMAGLAQILSSDPAGAADELGQSLALYRGVAQAAPDDPVRWSAVAEAESMLSHALLQAGQPGPAAAHDRAGIEALQRLTARDGGKPEWQTRLSELRLDLGDALMKIGDAAGALGAYGDDRVAGERLAAAQPKDPAWLHQMVVSLLRIAGAQLALHQPGAQRDALQAASAAADRSMALDPANPDARRDLVEARQGLAASELARGAFAPALAHYQEALAVAEASAAAHPDDIRLQLSHALALKFVAIGYRFNGQPDESASFDAKGATLLETLTPTKAAAPGATSTH